MLRGVSGGASEKAPVAAKTFEQAIWEGHDLGRAAKPSNMDRALAPEVRRRTLLIVFRLPVSGKFIITPLGGPDRSEAFREGRPGKPLSLRRRSDKRFGKGTTSVVPPGRQIWVTL